MSSIKITLNVSSPSKEDTYPLVLQLIHQRNKKIVRTTYSVKKQDFDANTGTVKFTTNTPYTFSEKEVNDVLAKRIAQMEDVLAYLNEYIGEYNVADAIALYKIECKSSLVVVFAAKMVRELRGNDQQPTSNAYQSTIKKLLVYTGGSKLTFDEIDREWIERYRLSLFNEGLKKNSIHFYLRILRSIYNSAQKMGVANIDTAPFLHQRYFATPPTKEVELKDEELERIITVCLDSDQPLSFARDLFLFCYYSCGMSFMDMAKARQTDIREDMLCYFCNRTKKTTNVKISPELRVLIEKYKNPESVYILPIFDSEEKSTFVDYRKKLRAHNALLKRLGSRLQLDCPLNSHVAQAANMSRQKTHKLSVTLFNDEGEKEVIKVVYSSIEEAKEFLMKALDDLKKKAKK